MVQGTILNEDPATPTINVTTQDVHESEGALVFSISLSNPTPNPVTIQYVVNGPAGTAEAGSDYDSESWFGADHHTAQYLGPVQISIPVVDDNLVKAMKA